MCVFSYKLKRKKEKDFFLQELRFSERWMGQAPLRTMADLQDPVQWVTFMIKFDISFSAMSMADIWPLAPSYNK